MSHSLSFFWDLILNKPVYQVLRVRDCMWASLQDSNTCSCCTLFTDSPMAEELFAFESDDETPRWKLFIKEEESKWMGKEEKISQNSYNIYQDGGIYSAGSGVPLHRCSNLESHWAECGCLWAEYLIIRRSTTTAKLNLPSLLLPTPTAHRHCCYFPLSSRGPQSKHRHKVSCNKDATLKPLSVGLQLRTHFKPPKMWT